MKLEEILTATKEELSQISLRLSMLVSTFRQSQLYAASSSQAREYWLDMLEEEFC